MFTHLHVHSHYSLLEAFGKPLAFVEKAKEHGMSALALTDYGGMYGSIEFYKAAKKHDIKPILGVDVGLVDDMQIKPKDEHVGRVVLLARNRDGYQHLLKLTTEAHLRGYHHKTARIDMQLLLEHHAGLVVIFSGPSSWLGVQCAHQVPDDRIIEQLTRLQEAVGREHVYVGIVAQASNDAQETHIHQKRIADIATQANLPLVATGNVHYPSSDDKDLYEILGAIRDGQRMFDKEPHPCDQALHDEATIRELLSTGGRAADDIDRMIDATADITTLCTVDIPLDVAHFPTHEPHPDIRALYEQYQDSLIVGT